MAGTLQPCVKFHQVWIQHVRNSRDPPEYDRNDDAKYCPAQKPDDRFQYRRSDMPPELARYGKIVQRRENAAGTAEYEGIENIMGGQNFPQGDEQDQKRNT